ncbi:hypothetical protein H632_c1025p1, partial [Helicosporidium sp. ATCC 50920]
MSALDQKEGPAGRREEAEQEEVAGVEVEAKELSEEAALRSAASVDEAVDQAADLAGQETRPEREVMVEAEGAATEEDKPVRGVESPDSNLPSDSPPHVAEGQGASPDKARLPNVQEDDQAAEEAAEAGPLAEAALHEDARPRE